jgi:hypothetical protein
MNANGRMTDPAGPPMKGEEAMANGSAIKSLQRRGGSGAIVARTDKAFNAGATGCHCPKRVKLSRPIPAGQCPNTDRDRKRFDLPALSK